MGLWHCPLLPGGTAVCPDPALLLPILGWIRCEPPASPAGTSRCPPGWPVARSRAIPGVFLPAGMPDATEEPQPVSSLNLLNPDAREGRRNCWVSLPAPVAAGVCGGGEVMARSDAAKPNGAIRKRGALRVLPKKTPKNPNPKTTP